MRIQKKQKEGQKDKSLTKRLIDFCKIKRLKNQLKEQVHKE